MEKEIMQAKIYRVEYLESYVERGVQSWRPIGGFRDIYDWGKMPLARLAFRHADTRQMKASRLEISRVD